MPIEETIGHPINKLSLICKSELSLINQVKKIYRLKKRFKTKRLILKERNFRFENIINIPAYKKITDTWNRIDNHLYGKRNNDFLLNLFFILKKLRKISLLTHILILNLVLYQIQKFFN